MTKEKVAYVPEYRGAKYQLLFNQIIFASNTGTEDHFPLIGHMKIFKIFCNN